MLELIHSLICKLPGGRDRILKYNAEILNMKNYDGSHGQSKLSSYPRYVLLQSLDDKPN